MRYVEVVLLVLVFMVVASGMSALGLVPYGTPRERMGVGIYDQVIMNVSSTGRTVSGHMLNYDDVGTTYQGNINCSLDQYKNSLECALSEYQSAAAGGSGWTKASAFLEPGIISSILNFIKIFSTGITHTHSIISSFIPHQSPLRDHLYIFTVPLIFMYILAVFQVISGRDLESAK
jgi:hypothetical protein